jgi:hypothetical protein
MPKRDLVEVGSKGNSLRIEAMTKPKRFAWLKMLFWKTVF